MKKIVYTILIIVLLGCCIGIPYALRYIYIGSSYNAKTVCSCLFVSGRDLDLIKKEDLYQVPYATIDVDYKTKIVRCAIYGLGKSMAMYRPGLGCTLVNEVSVEELLHQPIANLVDSFHADSVRRYPIAPNIDSIRLQQVTQEAFVETDSNNLKQTRAIVILHQGILIAEQYAQGISASTPLLGWSMTKSVTNAIVGLLVKDSMLQLDLPAPVGEWQHDERKNITIDQLLRMSSGLGFEEDYSQPSDATSMLFRKKAAGSFAMQSQLAYPPDTKWYYSSGTTNILQEIIRRQFKSLADYQSYPHQKLFDKIGMYSAIIEPDASGTFIGSSFMYATARDWSNFGQLYLQDGVWKGERILPEGWVKYSSTETPHSHGQYGAHFWMEHADPAFPQDAYYADGFEGQYVVIIPSKKLVIVRLGCTPRDGFDINSFVKDILSCVK